MIIWDKHKNILLRKERGISFEEIRRVLLAGKYLDSIENPARPHQMIYIINFRGYTYVVPYVVDNRGHIILKTAYPSRKFHKLYNK